MGLEQENAQLARRFWEALSRADVPAVRKLTRPELRWRTLGDNPYALETKGASEFLGLLASFGEAVDDLRMEVRDIFASDRGAVLHYNVVARRGSDLMECEYLALMRMRSGVVVEGTTAALDAQRNDAFWREARRPPHY
jgi:ketosteroid isomerase-like protein